MGAAQGERQRPSQRRVQPSPLRPPAPMAQLLAWYVQARRAEITPLAFTCSMLNGTQHTRLFSVSPVANARSALMPEPCMVSRGYRTLPATAQTLPHGLVPCCIHRPRLEMPDFGRTSG